MGWGVGGGGGGGGGVNNEDPGRYTHLLSVRQWIAVKTGVHGGDSAPGLKKKNAIQVSTWTFILLLLYLYQDCVCPRYSTPPPPPPPPHACTHHLTILPPSVRVFTATLAVTLDLSTQQVVIVTYLSC